jgi:hypothetical protein
MDLPCPHGAPLAAGCADCAGDRRIDGTHLGKSGSFLSGAYLEIVRRMNCIQCNEPPRSDPQHFPPKGRGVVRDDCTIPMCRRCHDAAGGIKVKVDGKLWPRMSDAQQRRMVLHVRALVWEYATPQEWAQISEDRARFYASKEIGQEVPW